MAIQDDIRAIRDKIDHYTKASKNAKAGGSEKKIYDDNVIRLQEQLFDLEKKVPIGERVSPEHKAEQARLENEAKKTARNAKRATTRMANKIKAQANKAARATETVNAPHTTSAADAMEEHGRQMRENARKMIEDEPARLARIAKQAVNPPDNKKPTLTPQDKKVLDALKKIGQPEKRPVFQASRFNLPQFTTDNSTGVVLGCVLIIFFIELHAGTKFVTLWNYAFSPGTKTIPTTAPTQATQDHTNLPDINIASNTEQDISALLNGALHGASPFLQGTGTYYGVDPNFHVLDGVLW